MSKLEERMREMERALSVGGLDTGMEDEGLGKIKMGFEG